METEDEKPDRGQSTTRVLVPVRYPLTESSRKTVERAVEIRGSSDEPVELIVLHVNLIQRGEDVRHDDLRREIASEFDLGATYVVRRGFIVEEKILEEAGRRGVDMVLIGRNRSGRLRRAFDRLVNNDPDIEAFLRQNLNVSIEVVG